MKWTRFSSGLSLDTFFEAVYNLFNPDFGEYEYIEAGRIFPIIFGLLIGFLVACCATVFDRRVLGDFVRHMLQNDCVSRENAKTLAELGYLKNSIIRGSLKSGVSLRRVIKCVEEEDFLAAVEAQRAAYIEANGGEKGVKPFKAPKFVMDTSTMHFYIPEELKYVADVKFEQKGTNALTLVLAFVLFIGIALLVVFLLPDLLQMLDNMLGMLDSKNNVLT